MAISKEMEDMAQHFVGKLIAGVQAHVARASKPHAERLDRLETRMAELEQLCVKRGKDAQ